MIQLDNKKKGIILALIILLIITVFFFFWGIRKNISNNLPLGGQKNTFQPRAMTESEKITKVGIDPSQKAEVVNDQNGLYIYRIKK
ncbi:MAG: hypothetical protein WCK59_04050 [Candidatus Falkowbacteria bacterium]